MKHWTSMLVTCQPAEVIQPLPILPHRMYNEPWFAVVAIMVSHMNDEDGKVGGAQDTAYVGHDKASMI